MQDGKLVHGVFIKGRLALELLQVMREEGQ
jgi:hypothetical protein